MTNESTAEKAGGETMTTRINRSFAMISVSAGLAISAVLAVGDGVAAANRVPSKVVAPITVPATPLAPADRCSGGDLSTTLGAKQPLLACLVA
ncbi:MAG TPA: hypothetical protein VGD57_08895 [Candidatus Dormibacteraeota bacterium]